jgi:hypothetical protein
MPVHRRRGSMSAMCQIRCAPAMRRRHGHRHRYRGAPGPHGVGSHRRWNPLRQPGFRSAAPSHPARPCSKGVRGCRLPAPRTHWAPMLAARHRDSSPRSRNLAACPRNERAASRRLALPGPTWSAGMNARLFSRTGRQRGAPSAWCWARSGRAHHCLVKANCATSVMPRRKKSAHPVR